MAAPSGTVWGSTVGSYGRIGIYTSISNANTESTLTVEVWFWSKYSVSDSSNTLYYDNLEESGKAETSKGSKTINTTVASGDGWSTSNQVKLATYTHTNTRGTSARTRYLYAKLTNVDRVGGTMSVSTTATIPKLASYTVKYDANGGSGAPSSQTKYYGKSLTLSKTTPTRTGYTFKGWGTSATDTSVDYAAGASYTSNKAITLYAIWTAKTYTVKYDANGGSGAPSDQTKTHGTALTLSSTKPTRTNYTFKGWGTSANATTVSYEAGASYSTNASITLYAIWSLAYIKPKITSLSVARCDASGVITDEGTYALVSFAWECEKEVTNITIEWKVSGEEETTYENVVASGTNGTVNQIVGNGNIDIDSVYTFTVSVTDEGGTSNTNKTLSGQKFPIDVWHNKAVAIGKSAEIENAFECEYDAVFYHDVYGGVLGLGYAVPIESNSDLNSVTSVGVYSVVDDNVAASLSNKAASKSGRLIVSSGVGRSARVTKTDAWSYITQIYITRDAHIFVRSAQTSGTPDVWGFTNWRELLPTSGGTMTGILRSEVGATWGGKTSTSDGHTGLVTGKEGYIVLQHETQPYISFYVGTDTTRKCRMYTTSAGSFIIENSTGQLQFTSTQLRPSLDDTFYLGGTSHRWKTVYAMNGTIQTSDRNQKENINEIDHKYEELFEKLKPVTFEFCGKEHDRVHVGFIAQDVKETMDEIGLSDKDFAAYCVDKKTVFDEEKQKDVEVLDANGDPVNMYSLRYNEFIALNTHMIQKQQKEIEDLKREINELKQLIKGTCSE